MTTTPNGIVRNSYERDVWRYYHEKRQDMINLLPGEPDGFYHHHFGIGDFDRSVADLPEVEREPKVLAEIHRLENALTDLIVDALDTVGPETRILDAGSGRGGTSFVLHDRFGCSVDGVNFASYQVEFAQELAKARDCADKVRFHQRNMVDTGFPDDYFDVIVTNETTMYVDLPEAFPEFARVLKPHGRYVLITWCINDAVCDGSSDIDQIDKNYVSKMHPRSGYFAELAKHGFVPNHVLDFSRDAVPYWELRQLSKHRTGIEDAYLSAYRQNAIQEILVATDYVPTSAEGRG
ncbi:geranyl diphosphate 2-C-methyltransferase [Herbihabitans rhizosphaerae]|uniref:Geranyl diphosphate 2-C-methyltransferase n=1 Tax=Herbihabitans rhizosphaerae TaxID=1872711 RepID=A0A4V2ERT1_9PSEU|nr:methyltransferase domain-containing protein [Herbihabitans rhizosphaerae]RZS33947.1 geranyl diphosphate 2-C-methyltransferase [Herbihabitans rhizosphaerae]